MCAGAGHDGPAVVPADGTAQDASQADALQQQLAAAEEDRDKAKKQLNRLCSAQFCYAVICLVQLNAGGRAVARHSLCSVFLCSASLRIHSFAPIGVVGSAGSLCQVLQSFLLQSLRVCCCNGMPVC